MHVGAGFAFKISLAGFGNSNATADAAVDTDVLAGDVAGSASGDKSDFFYGHWNLLMLG